MRKKLIISIFTLTSYILIAQEIGGVIPVWQEGEMEIHHIYTGGGEGVFCIFPDGTTMLIDAGDNGPHIDLRKTATSPNDSKRPGEWIARYILNRLEGHSINKIDYAFLTHFHGDHMGGFFEGYSTKTKRGGQYFLSGLSEVYEHVPFSKMIDRDWPGYQYPVPQEGKSFLNYLDFINWSKKNENMEVERFIPGSNKQFVLINNPREYPEFEIRNIVSNGEVWTGENNNTHKFFPDGESVEENKCSAGIRITYGDFDYFNGGDLSGRLHMHTPSWQDIEAPVGRAVGPVEVCEANHHGWVDAMNESFLSSVKAQIIVMQIYHVTHFNLTTMRSMTHKRLNPNLKHVIPTNIPEISRAYFGVDQLKKVTGEGGHVVIKVNPKGKQYSVYLLTTEDESYKIKSIYGPYICN